MIASRHVWAGGGLVVLVLALGLLAREHGAVDQALARVRVLQAQEEFTEAVAVLNSTNVRWRSLEQRSEVLKLRRALEGPARVQDEIARADVLFRSGAARDARNMLAGIQLGTGSPRQQARILDGLAYLEQYCQAQHLLLDYPIGAETFNPTGPILVQWRGIGITNGVNIYLTNADRNDRLVIATNYMNHSLVWHGDALPPGEYTVHVETADCYTTESSRNPVLITLDLDKHDPNSLPERI